MKGIIDFLEKRFVPIASKIGAQRHLVAIRDGFVVTMPLMIAGTIAVLINNFDYWGFQDFMPRVFGEHWKDFGGNVWWGTLAILSLIVAFSVAYNLAKSYGANPLSAGVMALANYVLFMPGLSADFTGPVALFGALLVSIVTTEIFVRLSKTEKLRWKMPESVPPAISDAFAALLPTLITIAIGALVALLITVWGNTDIYTFLGDAIQKPLMKLGNTLGASLLITFLTHLLWFFGLHGGNILDPIMQSVFVPAIAANASAIAAGLKPTYIVTKSFYDAFIYMGGVGTTFSLLLAIFVASKRKHYRSLAGFSIGQAAFNINEGVMFGLPVVLNPILFIPFLIGPIILTLIAYFATAIGLVPHTSVIIPWMSPPIIGGWLATGGSFMGALLSLVNLVVAFLIYLPFISVAEKVEEKRDKEAGLGA